MQLSYQQTLAEKLRAKQMQRQKSMNTIKEIAGMRAILERKKKEEVDQISDFPINFKCFDIFRKIGLLVKK